MSGWVIFGRLSLRELQWLCQRVVSVELLELRFVALIGDQNSPAELIQSLGLIFIFILEQQPSVLPGITCQEDDSASWSQSGWLDVSAFYDGHMPFRA
jgi:hypothetical protein